MARSRRWFTPMRRPIRLSPGSTSQAPSRWLIAAGSSTAVRTIAGCAPTTSNTPALASSKSTARAICSALGPLLRSVEFVELDIAFGDGDLQVDLGGHRALLRHYGPAHAADDQVVLVDDSVLLTGDLVLTGQFPIVPYFPPFEADVDANHWIDVLDELTSLQPAIVVPGHGDLSDIRAIAEVRDFLTYVRDMASQLRANGASADDAGASIEAAARARWPSSGASLHGSSGFAGRAFYTASTTGL